MSKKKPAKKEAKKPYAPIYIQSSNPDQSIFNFARNCAEDGIVVYFQSGKPSQPPACPPGGCH